MIENSTMANRYASCLRRIAAVTRTSSHAGDDAPSVSISWCRYLVRVTLCSYNPVGVTSRVSSRAVTDSTVTFAVDEARGGLELSGNRSSTKRKMRRTFPLLTFSSVSSKGWVS